MRNVLCQTNVFTTFPREATVAQLIFSFYQFLHTQLGKEVVLSFYISKERVLNRESSLDIIGI